MSAISWTPKCRKALGYLAQEWSRWSKLALPTSAPVRNPWHVPQLRGHGSAGTSKVSQASSWVPPWSWDWNEAPRRQIKPRFQMYADKKQGKMWAPLLLKSRGTVWLKNTRLFWIKIMRLTRAARQAEARLLMKKSDVGLSRGGATMARVCSRCASSLEEENKWRQAFSGRPIREQSPFVWSTFLTAV